MTCNPPLTEAHVATVCKIGQQGCCRYLVYKTEGFSCAKHVPDIARTLDSRVAAGTMRAVGDNCEGMIHIEQEAVASTVARIA